MMKFRWGNSLRTADYLERQLTLHNFSQRLLTRRAEFPILVIDDEPFSPIEFLRRHNFNITHMPDAPSIDTAARFSIVLCDILGVGKGLNPSRQGVQLISEIKKSYPEKIVVAYTGGGSSPLVEQAIQIADSYLKKDASLEEWLDCLDRSIKELANPADVWRKLRHRLLDAGATPYQLAQLEDTFVSHALEGRSVYEPALLSEAGRVDLKPAAREIMRHLIATAIFELGKAALTS
jgi:hypothetical protein